MIDLIPVELYTPIYYYTLLLVVLMTIVHTITNVLGSAGNKSFIKGIGLFTLLFVLLYLGLRPINNVFVDMTTYNYNFESYVDGAPIIKSNDLLFHIFTKLSAQIMNAQMYFFSCACLYVIPLYLVSKKWFNQYWFYGFLFLVASFSFWAYGTNGIRNGIAGSLFLLGMSRRKSVWQIAWIIVAVNFHQSMMLPALGFVLANIFNKPKVMIGFWLLTIPASLIGGGVFESFFSSIGFGEDDRMMSYFYTGPKSIIHDVFRWDFLLYSATAVFAGWYYIVKLKYNDKIYFKLFNTYVFANAFWILVIRASFSNRFAYLSWFMIALVIIYPLLRERLFFSQHKKIGILLAAYFAFTFIMSFI